MARRFQAKVTLLHVIRTPHLWQRDLVSEELSALVDISPVWTGVHDEISFARLGWQLVLCAVDLRFASRVGRSPRRSVWLPIQHAAELMVGRLRSSAAAIIREAPCPVVRV
jgi:hypothetical protein